MVPIYILLLILHMAPWPHIIAHMDLDMVLCTHIITNMDTDMAQCLHICNYKFIISY